MLLAGRLNLPPQTQAILWDMDGVLLDTLGLDLVLCNQLLHQYADSRLLLSKAFIRSIFAYHSPEFWQKIFARLQSEFEYEVAPELQTKIRAEYDRIRNESKFEVNPGIREVLEAARAIPLKLAVVSNNLTAEVEGILTQAGLRDYFDLVVGNDLEKMAKKPAPDAYLYAARHLQLVPPACAVIEDSLVGLEAGFRAGCYTIGVATGGTTFDELEHSSLAQQVYSAFEVNQLAMSFGQVTQKSITTPNDFVSHMIEHIAWRVGCTIQLTWNHNDWQSLGQELGRQLGGFEKYQSEAVALGMIDDGSAEVLIESSSQPQLKLGSKRADLAWFLGLRCEQIRSGRPLVQLLEGISTGLGATIQIDLCSVEDPHHTWEGVFRSVGIALNQMITPRPQTLALEAEAWNPQNKPGDLAIENLTPHSVKVTRQTAESIVSVAIDWKRQTPSSYRFRVSSTIEVENFKEMLEALAQAGGFHLQVNFDATVLNSSHVVLEDTALVLGRGLKEMLLLRMNAYGVDGAGSSLAQPQDLEQPISVGVSVEGRKFWKLVPLFQSEEALKKEFILGKNVCGHLRSEDLDDFIDGLAGGLDCSVMVHFKQPIDPAEGWLLLFRHLGQALQGVFRPNPYRKGVPPGVKATMY